MVQARKLVRELQCFSGCSSQLGGTAGKGEGGKHLRHVSLKKREINKPVYSEK